MRHGTERACHHPTQERGRGGVQAQMTCQPRAQFPTGRQAKGLEHLTEPGRHPRPGVDKDRKPLAS